MKSLIMDSEYVWILMYFVGDLNPMNDPKCDFSHGLTKVIYISGIICQEYQ